MAKIFTVKWIFLLITLSVIYMFYLNFQIFSKGNSILKEIFVPNVSSPINQGPRGLLILLNGKLNALKTPQSAGNQNSKTSTFTLTSKSLQTQRKIHPFAQETKYRSNWETTPYRGGRDIPFFTSWQTDAESVCDGKITLYDYNFLHTTSMIIDKDKAKSVNFGGEDIEAVILQDESKEYYEYEMGFFRSVCSKRPSYTFDNKNHLNEWLFNLQTKADDTLPTPLYHVNDFTIAVVRYEYANLYHTMTDWYNAFLLKEFFNKTAAETNILIIDSHPQGMLDSVWSHLFNYTRRISKLPSISHFTNLVWGILGYNSPLKSNWFSYKLPLIEEFRTFFLNAFNVDEPRTFDCERLKILVIWRRDYLAHPRNPKGLVSRKIANELELAKHLRETLPSEKFSIRTSQIDRFNLSTQLEMVVWADVMVGMHGAGLTHAIFLRKTSGLVELRPNYYGGEHFEAIAKWRGLPFYSWKNDNPSNEQPNMSTIIPPETLVSLINQTAKAICSTAQYKLLFGLRGS